VVGVGRLSCQRGRSEIAGRNGATGKEDILKLYPYLQAADIDAALQYAAWRVEEIEVPVLRASA